MTTTTLKLQPPIQTEGFVATAVQGWQMVQLWRSRARQRRQLANLAPELLHDLGITLDAARAEIAKPFWRA